MVEFRSPGQPGHLLQTAKIRILRLNDIDDPLEPIAAIVAADALMDVVAEESHRLILLEKPCSALSDRTEDSIIRDSNFLARDSLYV